MTQAYCEQNPYVGSFCPIIFVCVRKPFTPFIALSFLEKSQILTLRDDFLLAIVERVLTYLVLHTTPCLCVNNLIILGALPGVHRQEVVTFLLTIIPFLFCKLTQYSTMIFGKHQKLVGN